MAEIPIGAQAGLARYLLGLGPMPPLRPEVVALAQICGALDRGAFEQPWPRNANPLILALPAPIQGAVHPADGPGGGQPHQPPEGQF